MTEKGNQYGQNIRFIIDESGVRDIFGFIEPIPVISSYQAIQVRDLLNNNWEQFNKQKCLIKRLRNQIKKSDHEIRS